MLFTAYPARVHRVRNRVGQPISETQAMLRLCPQGSKGVLLQLHVGAVRGAENAQDPHSSGEGWRAAPPCKGEVSRFQGQPLSPPVSPCIG